jgi:hypothetical protein
MLRPIGWVGRRADSAPRAARARAALAVLGGLLVRLRREIGREILDHLRRESRGTKVIDRLAADLRRGFPEMTGLSRSDLFQQSRPAPEDGGQEPLGRQRS